MVGMSVPMNSVGRSNVTTPSAEGNALRAGSIPSAYALGSGFGRHEPPTCATFASLRKTVRRDTHGPYASLKLLGRLDGSVYGEGWEMVAEIRPS